MPTRTVRRLDVGTIDAFVSMGRGGFSREEFAAEAECRPAAPATGSFGLDSCVPWASSLLRDSASSKTVGERLRVRGLARFARHWRLNQAVGPEHRLDPAYGLADAVLVLDQGEAHMVITVIAEAYAG